MSPVQHSDSEDGTRSRFQSSAKLPVSDLERYEHYVITHSRMQGAPDGDNAERLLSR